MENGFSCPYLAVTLTVTLCSHSILIPDRSLLEIKTTSHHETEQRAINNKDHRCIYVVKGEEYLNLMTSYIIIGDVCPPFRPSFRR